jgi:hypothetical protein
MFGHIYGTAVSKNLKIEGSCAQSASMLRPRLAGTVRVNLIALNSPAIIQYLI